jgi:hypothetical protein
MLIRFGFSNFRSIKDYQEVSFVAASISDDCADLILTKSLSEKILPAIAIYGGNATGKSNLLKAFAFARAGILRSQSAGSVTGGIRREYFRLDKVSREEPSLFDCDFILDEVRYHYGFSIDNQQVIEEWLYAYPKNHKQVWFHRRIDEENQFYFGKALKGKNRTIESLTRKNSLFLSSAAQNNHEMLTPIYNYFSNQIEFDFGRGSIPAHVFERYLKDENEKEWLIKFLTSADIGIVNINVKSDLETDDDSDLHNDIIEVIKKHVFDEDEDDDGDEKLSELKAALSKGVKVEHGCSDGSIVELKLSDESLGTRKLIAILGPIYEALKNGSILIIDEIDTSMHPLLSRKLIQLFQSRETNPNNAQLLFTTHDTNLLSGRFLRRDQVWFTEKNEKGSTIIYPLTDISTRKGDNIENGYLQGRYGAIPYLGNLDSLFDQLNN